jgi:hypothetical protein
VTKKCKTDYIDKSSIKVLPCYFRLCNIKSKGKFFVYQSRKEIEPVFNKNGFYYCRKSGYCWEENGGKAFEMDAKTFLYKFQQYHLPWLSDYEYQLGENLLKLKIANRILSQEGMDVIIMNRWRRTYMKQMKINTFITRKRIKEFKKINEKRLTN